MQLRCPNFCHFSTVIKAMTKTEEGFLTLAYDEDNFDPSDFENHGHFEVEDADVTIEAELLCGECGTELQEVEDENS